MKGIILAAGSGERFRPLTALRPKPMLPVGSKALLEHVVNALETAGITEIIIVVGHGKERIQNHFGSGDEWDLEIQYVTQERPLGTGHALLQAESLVGDDFLVLNGDRIVEPALLEQLIKQRQQTARNQIAVTRVDDPTQYGMVELEGDQVTDIVEKPPEHAATSQIANVGVYAFGPEIFAAIRGTDSHGELELTTVLARNLESQPLSAVPYDGMWFELTRPWDLLTATQTFLAHDDGRQATSATIHQDASVVDPVVIGADAHVGPGARLLRNSVIGPNVRIGANAVIENAVIASEATIEAGAVVRDAIIGASATIGANTTIAGGKGDVIVDETVYPDVTFGGLIGDQTVLQSNVTVEPGTIIGNYATVGSNRVVSGTFPLTN